MKIIPLTQGRETIVDDADYEQFAQFKWHFVKAGYASRRLHGIGQNKVLMHRVIVGALPGEDVDHINGDGLDNRRSNLRRVAHVQNCWNRRNWRPNKSGIPGVQINRLGTYDVQIMTNGVSHWIGTFKTGEEARLSRSEASRRLHGEFASYHECCNH